MEVLWSLLASYHTDVQDAIPLSLAEREWLLSDHGECPCGEPPGRERLTRCSRIGLYTSCEACGSHLSRYADSGVKDLAEMECPTMSRWQIIEASS